MFCSQARGSMFSYLISSGSIVILLLWITLASSREIYISPSGNDSTNCTKDAPCKTLDNGLFLASFVKTVRLVLTKGNYPLKVSHNFTHMTAFGISGAGATRIDVKITCAANISLSFVLSANITLERITLQKCGGWHMGTYGANKNYPDLKGAKFKTALYFRYCRNLRISGIEISSSPGLGATLYDVGGFVSFTDSVFANNTVLNNRSFEKATGGESNAKYRLYSGGGVFLMLNPYSNNTVNVTPEEHDSYQHDNNFLFLNCSFLGNVAQWSNTVKGQKANTLARPFSRGGGLAVFFQGNASRCFVEIQACLFASNKASWGGGLQLEMNNITENNTFKMGGTIFRNNFAIFAGGGARIGNVPVKGAQLILNQFNISNCSFTENTAEWGGGLSLYGTTIPRKCTKHTDLAVTQFRFSRCSWQNNVGNVGAAMGMYLYNQNKDQIGPEIPYRVCFDNDTLFESNEVRVHNQTLTIGQGAVYSVQVPLIFKTNLEFLNNSKSALVLDGSTLEVHDQVQFINNSGFRRGAIAMYGRSRIIFHPNSNLVFEGNTCEDRGGAFYIQDPGSPLVSFNATGTNMFTCFFGYSDNSADYNEWNTSVTFKDNNCRAQHCQCKGKSVYATTLKSCWRVGESRENNSVLRWKFVEFDNFSVATDPVEIRYSESDWKFAPGEVFDANVKLFDELNNTVQGIISIRIKSSSSIPVTVNNQSSSLFLTTGKGKISGIQLKGFEGSSFSIELNCVGSHLLQYVIPTVTLRKCHDGFIFSPEKLKCQCMESTDNGGRGISRCGYDGKTLFVKEGYWAGQVDGKMFSTYICPAGYCNGSDSSSNEYMYVKNHVCQKGRNQSSTLCGQCEKNCTITFGSEQCTSECSNWYLLLFIPLSVGFFLIVMGIMLIDHNVFTGYFNAWLSSYQVMKLLAPDGFQFNSFSEFMIALSNTRIQLGDHGFCLLKGLDDGDKLMFMYAAPVYELLLVVLLWKMAGAFPNWWFTKRVKYPIRGICAIYALCYTDITSTSLKILRFTNVGSKTVFYANGSMDYFSGKHLLYGIIAIAFIVLFVLPLPFILLFRPYLTRGLRPVLNLNRWRPFFDSLQSCFKDQYRWCAAFYFFCRFGISLIYTFMPPGAAKRLFLEGVCILILLSFAIIRPYKEASDVAEGQNSYEWMNKSDIMTATTLSLVAVVSSPLDNICATTQDEMNGIKILLNILSFVPVAVLLAVVYCAVKKCLHSRTTEDHVTEETTSLISDSSESEASMTETSETQRGSRGIRSRRSRTPRSQYGSLDNII